MFEFGRFYPKRRTYLFCTVSENPACILCYCETKYTNLPFRLYKSKLHKKGIFYVLSFRTTIIHPLEYKTIKKQPYLQLERQRMGYCSTFCHSVNTMQIIFMIFKFELLEGAFNVSFQNFVNTLNIFSNRCIQFTNDQN